jgi:hypothetical protein
VNTSEWCVRLWKAPRPFGVAQGGGYIAAKYGLNSRKYQAYSLGNGNYLRKGLATLHSDQGEILKCEISYRGVNGRGHCESGPEKFDVVIAEPAQPAKNVAN